MEVLEEFKFVMTVGSWKCFLDQPGLGNDPACRAQAIAQAHGPMARRAGLGDPIGHLYWGHVHSCGGRELPQAHEGAILFYFFPIGKVSNVFY